jgi:hypothetical protein
MVGQLLQRATVTVALRGEVAGQRAVGGQRLMRLIEVLALDGLAQLAVEEVDQFTTAHEVRPQETLQRGHVSLWVAEGDQAYKFLVR